MVAQLRTVCLVNSFTPTADRSAGVGRVPIAGDFFCSYRESDTGDC